MQLTTGEDVSVGLFAVSSGIALSVYRSRSVLDPAAAHTLGPGTPVQSKGQSPLG